MHLDVTGPNLVLMCAQGAVVSLRPPEDPRTLTATFSDVFFRNRQPKKSVALKKLSKCWLWMQKTQKIEPDPNFFLTDESF